MTDLSYTLDETRPRRVGLIVLQSDESLETDMRRLCPDGVEYLVSRVPSGTHVSPETLAAMEDNLTAAASLFPEGIEFDAVGYGCTSGTAQIGAAQVAARIQAGVSARYVTNPLTALIAACKERDIKRLGLISPYTRSVSDTLVDALAQAGLRVTRFASFNQSEESQVVRISAGSLRDAAIEMGRNDECDAVFLSCTNLRTLDVLGPVEQVINKPVLSSNQVMVWDLLRS